MTVVLGLDSVFLIPLVLLAVTLVVIALIRRQRKTAAVDSAPTLWQRNRIHFNWTMAVAVAVGLLFLYVHIPLMYVLVAAVFNLLYAAAEQLDRLLNKARSDTFTNRLLLGFWVGSMAIVMLGPALFFAALSCALEYHTVVC